MGFLDRMISDLIQDNTGINARKLVRNVGGGKLLAMGGAALAAGMFAEKKGMFGQGASASQPAAAPGTQPQAAPGPPPPIPGQTSTGQQAPPPPPVPGQTSTGQQAPPPPPLPGAITERPAEPAAASDGAPDDELPGEVTYAIVRTMVAAALADGHLAPEEKAMIQKHLGESGLSEAQTAQVHKDLVLPPSADELATLAGDGPAREALYRFGALVVLADQEASDLERGWLERLATAFELDNDRKAALEAEIFSPGGESRDGAG